MKKARTPILMLMLLAVLLVLILFATAGRERSIEAMKAHIALEYGVPISIVERYADALPDEWQPGDGIPDGLLGDLAPSRMELARSGISIEDDPDTGATLTFAHLGDGAFVGQESPLQTSYTITNNTRATTTGIIEFFRDDGSPLELEIDGVTASTFPFELGRNQTQRFTTSGAGEIKSGWARIRSQQQLVVRSSFGAIRADGTVITDVGVTESEPGDEFTIFADTIGSNDTGVALTNPNPDVTTEIEMILRDASGSMVDREVLSLAPLNHTAGFLSDLFPDAPGIAEFEGTVLLRSLPAGAAPTASEPAGEADRPLFAGLTLRTSGTVFTSLPFVPPVPAQADYTRLAFPQAADGNAGDLSISTTSVLFNNTDQPASGVIEFFKGDGSPNQVTVGGARVSEIPFEVAPGGVFRVTTDGVGEVAVGWARVTMDQPLAGVVIFTITDRAGQIVSAVGVNSASLRQQMQLMVDTTRLFDTALAIINPLEPEPGIADPVTIRLNLRNSEGGFAGPEKRLELGSLEHQALFITELFPEVEGIDEFVGRLDIIVSGSRNFAAALSLRSAREKLTSVPVFAERLAFQPFLRTQFASTIKGSHPILRWELRQSSRHLVVDEMETEFTGVSLRTAGVEVGDVVANGHLDRPAGTVQWIVSQVSEDQIEFDMASFSDEFQIVGVGVLESHEAGVRIRLNDETALPGNSLFLSANTSVFLDAGLLEVEDAASELTIRTSFLSVPVDSDGTSRIRLRTEETLPLQDPDATRANILGVQPSFLTADEQIVIHGTQFGSDPTVLFQGETFSVSPDSFSDSEIVVTVPPGVASGGVRVDNGNGPSTFYQLEPLFAPVFHVEQSPGLDDLVFEISQMDNIARLEAFEIRSYRTDAVLAGFSVGERIGTYSVGFFGDSGVGLFVTSTDGSQVELEIASEPGVNVQGNLILQQLEPGVLSLRTAPPEEPSTVPRFLLGDFRTVIRLDGVALTLPPTGGFVYAEAVLESTPLPSLADELFLDSFQVDGFVREP